MRLLLLGPVVPRLAEIRNFSGVWAYYLPRALGHCGVDTVVTPAPDDYETLDFYGADHIIALGTRHFDKVGEHALRTLRRRFGGTIAQVHDGLAKAAVDVTFTIKETGAERHHCVGWAGDPEMLKPQQDPKIFTVLVDHPDYVTGRGDRTGDVLSQLSELICSGILSPRFPSIAMSRIADGGLVPAGAPLLPFTRQHMEFPRMCAAYGRAHVFMVTHPESVGLSALEASMAGALPVVPRGYIEAGLLQTVRHYTYSSVIDWKAVLEKIDPMRSRTTALVNVWSAVAERIIEWLEVKGRSASSSVPQETARISKASPFSSIR